ncbi:hypothetical protein GLOIN_2v1829228 [Rhizophagus irregularis DAOM 181602=DAOM 197198]|nr:hypothetical protein RhiirB3_457383 [Rhizophagus irregularis]GET53886.1 hypothetical protein GLOIN_2v1829228 [Rhizophagus irregularis DAOM 181602=DAOM 197198]
MTQGNSFISKYFEYVKLYAMLTGKDLDDVDVKIVKYLVRDSTLSTEIQKYKVGELKQEVKLWGMNLPLDELIERLETLEQLSG